MIPEYLWLKFVEQRAVFDSHHNQVFNGYEPASKEYMVYQEKIEELKLFKKGLH